MSSYYGSFRHLTHIVAYIFACLVLCGCTLNDHGLEGWTCRTERRNHPGGVEVDVEAWGLYITTNPADAGAILGHCRKAYFFASPSGPGGSRVPPVSINRTDPLCVWTEAQGIIAGTNPSQVGVSLGMQSRQVLTIPQSFHGIVELNIDSTHKEAAHFKVER